MEQGDLCVRCGQDADTYFCGQTWCYQCRMDFWLEKPERLEAVIKFLSERGRTTPVERLNRIIENQKNRYQRRLARIHEMKRLAREQALGFGHDAGLGSGSDTAGGLS